MNARNCKGLINNAVQEFLTNTASLQTDGCSHWDRYANSSSVPEIHVLQTVGHMSRQHHMQRQEYNGRPTSKLIQGRSDKWHICCHFRLLGINKNTPTWKETEQATQFYEKSILSSFSVIQRQSDSCPHHQRESSHHLKCCSRRYIHFNRHRSLRWWMKRKVEEDVVNVAPNLRVLFCFPSPEILRHDSAHSLQLRLKMTQPMNRSWWSSWALFEFST